MAILKQSSCANLSLNLTQMILLFLPLEVPIIIILMISLHQNSGGLVASSSLSHLPLSASALPSDFWDKLRFSYFCKVSFEKPLVVLLHMISTINSLVMIVNLGAPPIKWNRILKKYLVLTRILKLRYLTHFNLKMILTYA